jgi:hypothetical protein
VKRLVIRPGAIGDLILSLPALESLRTAYTEVWVSGPNVPLVRFADRVRSIAATGLNWLGVIDPPAYLLDELRSFDSIVSWYGANRPEFRELTESLGLQFTFHQALPVGSGLLPSSRPRGRLAPAQHATDFYLEQLGLPPGAVPRIPCDVSRERFAVIHPFSGSARKNWPLERFRALARGLERTMPVCWCVGREDPPLDGAVHIDDLYDLACWLARASLYIGNDCGVTHLAAAVGTPVLALFGPTDPAVWGPRNKHVRIARW